MLYDPHTGSVRDTDEVSTSESNLSHTTSCDRGKVLFSTIGHLCYYALKCDFYDEETEF